MKFGNKSFFHLASIFMLKGGGALGQLALTIIIAKALNIEDAGIFFLCLNILVFLTPISIFGFHIIGLREISLLRKKVSETISLKPNISKFIAYSAVSSLIISSAGYCFADEIVLSIFQKEKLLNPFRITMGCVWVNGILFVISNQLQALQKYTKALLIVSIITPYLTALGVLVGSITSVELITWIYLTALLISLFLGLTWLLLDVGFQLDFSLTTFKENLKSYYNSSIYLVVISLMIVTVNWSNQLIGGVYLSNEDIAVFSAAQRTANVINLILISASYFITPKISPLYFNNKMEELQRLVSKSSAMMIFAALPLLVIIFLFSPKILSMFGETYARGSLALCVLAFGQFINVVTGIVNPVLTMTGNEKRLVYVVLVSATSSVGLGLILIPQFGLIGGVVATSLALVIQNLMAVWQVKKAMHIDMFKLDFSPIQLAIQR